MMGWLQLEFGNHHVLLPIQPLLCPPSLLRNILSKPILEWKIYRLGMTDVAYLGTSQAYQWIHGSVFQPLNA